MFYKHTYGLIRLALEQVKSMYPYETAVIVVYSRLCLKRRKI